MHANTVKAMDTAPARWDDLIPETIDQDVITVASELLSHAVGASRRAAYFNARGMGKSHHAAVKESNRVVRTVAKALGYSYPKAHELSF